MEIVLHQHQISQQQKIKRTYKAGSQNKDKYISFYYHFHANFRKTELIPARLVIAEVVIF